MKGQVKRDNGTKGPTAFQYELNSKQVVPGRARSCGPPQQAGWRPLQYFANSVRRRSAANQVRDNHWTRTPALQVSGHGVGRIPSNIVLFEIFMNEEGSAPHAGIALPGTSLSGRIFLSFLPILGDGSLSEEIYPRHRIGSFEKLSVLG